MYLKANTVVEAMVELSTVVQSEIEKYKLQAEASIPLPMKYKALPKTSDYVLYSYGAWTKRDVTLNSSSNEWLTFYHGDYKKEDITAEDVNARYAHILSVVDKYLADCKVVQDENTVIMEHNKSLKDKVGIIMKALGVPDYYTTSEYKSSRSRTPTSTKHTAGYIGDLNRLIGNPPSTTISLDNIKYSLSNTRDKLLTEIRNKEREKEKQIKDQENLHILAALRVKYTPDNFTSDAEEMLDGILSKCKYLHLAYYLEKNRNDWNDGYSYAETGLNNFDVETQEDKEIYESLNTIIQQDYDSGCIDGRAFRDCEYNYGFLYGKVEESLLADFHKVVAMVQY